VLREGKTSVARETSQKLLTFFFLAFNRWWKMCEIVSHINLTKNSNFLGHFASQIYEKQRK